MRWIEFRTFTALLRREFQLGVRTPLFWALFALGSGYALWRSLTAGGLLSLACYQVGQFAVLGLGVAGVLTGGAAAGRDAREQAQEVVLAKPLGNRPLLVAARFLGAWLALLALVLVMLAVVGLGTALSGGRPWDPVIYGHALARTLVPLALATAVGFALTTLFATPLAAGIAALYWVAVPLAQAHLPAIFDMTVIQHWPMALLFALALVALSGWRYGRAIAGISRRSVGLSAVALGGAAVLAALFLVAQGDDALARPSPMLSAMSGQSVQDNARAPGFWLPEAQGRLVGLEDVAGGPVLLTFWSPTDPSLNEFFAALHTLAAQYRAQHLTCVAICVDRDAGTLAPFAREVGAGLVMLQDRGRHFSASRTSLDSALVTAYMVEQTPSAFLLDRNRVLRQSLPGCGPGDLAVVVRRTMEQ